MFAFVLAVQITIEKLVCNNEAYEDSTVVVGLRVAKILDLSRIF